MKNQFILLLFISILILSCDNNEDTSLTENNFYALSVGNSWIYKNYVFNSLTDEYEYLGIVDSISIIDTESIKGEVYYKLRRMTIGNENRNVFCNVNGEHFSLLRDSIGFLINDKGAIKYANNNFSEREAFTVSPGIIAYEKLLEEKTKIDTEAGSFICFDTERYARQIDNNKLFPALDHRYYADGIGFVADTQSYLAGNTPFVIRRLDSYSIK